MSTNEKDRELDIYITFSKEKQKTVVIITFFFFFSNV